VHKIRVKHLSDQKIILRTIVQAINYISWQTNEAEIGLWSVKAANERETALDYWKIVWISHGGVDKANKLFRNLEYHQKVQHREKSNYAQCFWKSIEARR
jgi:hypothetical protein